LWALADLFPNNPDPVALRETGNRARRNLARAHKSVRRLYDRGRRPNNFVIGQLVMVRNYPQSRAADRLSAKLAPPPFRPLPRAFQNCSVSYSGYGLSREHC
jgi:hypothetical protein